MISVKSKEIIEEIVAALIDPTSSNDYLERHYSKSLEGQINVLSKEGLVFVIQKMHLNPFNLIILDHESCLPLDEGDELFSRGESIRHMVQNLSDATSSNFHTQLKRLKDEIADHVIKQNERGISSDDSILQMSSKLERILDDDHTEFWHPSTIESLQEKLVKFQSDKGVLDTWETQSIQELELSLANLKNLYQEVNTHLQEIIDLVSPVNEKEDFNVGHSDWPQEFEDGKKVGAKWYAVLHAMRIAIMVEPPLPRHFTDDNSVGALKKQEIKDIGRKYRSRTTGDTFYKEIKSLDLNNQDALTNSLGPRWIEKMIYISRGDQTVKNFLVDYKD